MLVLFSADHHIKLGQKHVPIEWAKARYHEMFKQLHQLELSVDLHIIGGDFFDKVPSTEELELYFDYVEGCQCKTIIFDGNHEATKKGKTFFSNLKKVTNRINSYVQIVDDYYSNDIFDIIPYCKLKEFEKVQPEFRNNLLFSHFRGNIEPHVKAEIDLSLFKRWDTVLAGDLHDKECSQLNISYPGSPLTTSFHRNRKDTGVIIIETDTLAQEWVKLELPQLIRKTIQAGEDMPAGEYDHVIYEVEGDMSQLGNVASSDLIDKKIVKRSSDCALILKPEATVIEELVEYLKYIAELPDETVDEVLAEYNNNIKGVL